MADIKNHVSLPTSLVSYWDLEEASGTRYDLVGSNNLSDNNTVTGGTGKVGEGAVFATANTEHLKAVDNASWDLTTTNDKSFSVWIKPANLSNNYAILSRWNESPEAGGKNFLFRLNTTGKLQAWVGTGATTGVTTGETTTTLSAGTWYHAVVTWSGTVDDKMRIYVNGSLDTTGATASPGAASGPLYIGESSSASPFDGSMDEIGWWDKALTSTEITALYNSGSGLPYYDPADVKNDTTLATSLDAYYELEEATATTTWTDSHTNSANLTNVSSGSGITSVAGKQGQGADLEASSNEYFKNTSPSGVLTGWTGDFSFAGWLNVESLPSSGSFYGIAGCWNFGGGDAGNDWLLYYLNDSGTPHLYLQWNEETTHGTTSSFPAYTLTTATWFHLVVVADTNTPAVKWYINGVLISEHISGVAGDNGTVNAGGADFFLGAYNHTTPGSFFDGVIDEVAIYNKQLSVAEVRALYGYGTPPVYEVVAGSASSSPSPSVSSSPSPSVSSSPSPSVSSSPSPSVSSSPSPSESASVSSSPSVSVSSSPSPSSATSPSSSPSPSVSSSPSPSPSASPSPQVWIPSPKPSTSWVAENKNSL